MFGPISEWIESTRLSEIPRIERAKRLVDAALNPIAWRVMLRMCCFWEYYIAFQDQHGPDVQFPYMIGVVMDLHVPSIDNDSIYTIYKNGTAPEQVPLKNVAHDEWSMLGEKTLETLWKDYIGMGIVNSKSPSAGAPSAKPKKNSSRKRKRTPKTVPFNSLVPPIKPVQEQSHPAKILIQLLSKGIAEPGSSRYIIDSLDKALPEHPGKPVKEVVQIIQRMLLGAFKHAQVIAPPYMRMMIYKSDHRELFDWCILFTPPQLYVLLSEVIVSNNRHHLPLTKLVNSNPNYAAYYKQATIVADREIRYNLYDFVEGLPKPPATPTSIIPEFNHYHRSSHEFACMIKVIGISKKISVKNIQLATKNRTIAEIIECLQCQPNDIRIYRSMLIDIGVSGKDMGIIEFAFNATRDEKPNKRFSKMKKQLSPEGRAKLIIYLHYIVERSAMGALPIQKPVVEKNKSLNDPHALVCNSCYTVRARCKIPNAPRKPKDGIEIDFVNGKFVCAACKGDTILAVDMRKNYLYGPPLSDPNRPQTLCRCHHCGTITSVQCVIGETDLCYDCYASASSKLIARTCLCGHALSEKQKHPCVVALNAKKRAIVISFCSKHKHVIHHRKPGEIMPVAFYKTLMGA